MGSKIWVQYGSYYGRALGPHSKFYFFEISSYKVEISSYKVEFRVMKVEIST